MTETEKTEMKENRMKKQIRWILICLAAGLAFLLGGCGGNTLSTPGRVQIDPITLTLSWKAVGGAAYYTVEITGNGTTVKRIPERTAIPWNVWRKAPTACACGRLPEATGKRRTPDGHRR